MARISIRRANEWDAPAMLKLYSPYVLGTHVTTPEEEIPTLSEYIQRIDRYTYGLGWVTCEIDSVPVGFCRLYENPDCPQNLFSLCVELYVASFSLRIGVGSALLALIIRIMSHGNRREIWARVPLPNQTAVAFFEKRGFCAVRIQTEAFEKQGITHDMLCMKKQLIPDDPHAAHPTKPYLIVNNDYEAARAHAASLIHESITIIEL